MQVVRVKWRGCVQFWRAEANLDVDGVVFWGRVSCPVLKPDALEDSVRCGVLITRASVCVRARVYDFFFFLCVCYPIQWLK